VVESLRRDPHQAVGELERGRMSHLEGRRVVERGELAMHGLTDFATPVTGIDAPQAGGAVEDLAAICSPVVHAFGARQQARVLLELPVGSERHPEGFELLALGTGRQGHGDGLQRLMSA
jgi:hypothetical protein